VLTPNGFSGQARAWDPKLRPALTQQWNFTGEYQFGSTFSMTAGYVGQRGKHLANTQSINQPLPGTGPVSSWAPLQARRPFNAALPAVTNIVETQSSATMNYNALQVSGRKRLKTEDLGEMRLEAGQRVIGTNAADTGPDGTIYFVGAIEVRPEPGKPVEAAERKIGSAYYRLALLIFRPRA